MLGTNLVKQKEKKFKLSMINTIIVIKNFFNEIVSKLISVKERISELKDRSIKITQIKSQRDKRLKTL